MRRRLVAGLLAGVACAAGMTALDRLRPPDLSRYRARSLVLLDREGRLLDGRTSSDDAWRIATRRGDVDPAYLRLLMLTEDRRFPLHPGVDPFAIARAAVQLAVRWHVVSGGSTLAMQTARLLSPHRHDLVGKLRDALRALQLEARYGRAGVLDMYLTLTPEGGNIEGVEAASLLYFGHGPAHLSPREAALLVALPRRPTAWRPDRYPLAAEAAARHVLDRAGIAPGLDPQPTRRVSMPHDAPALLAHEWALGRRGRVRTTIDGDLQRSAMRISAAMEPPAHGEFATIVTRHDHSAAVWIGGSGAAAGCRGCAVDMVTAHRSPGSTLKPFVYGMAFDAGVLTPETAIRDERLGFSGYMPRNFDHVFHGVSTARVALQQSYNLPAVQVLRQVGPARLVAGLAACGIRMVLPAGATPNLALALGGGGITMRDLASLYGSLDDGGQVHPVIVEMSARDAGTRLMEPRAAREVAEILRGTPPPAGVVDWTAHGVAFKTGTSYGQRDAWAAGTTPDWTVIVWAGRPDGTASPGITGRGTAAPLMARILDVLQQDEPGRTEAVSPLPRLNLLSPSLRSLGTDDGPHLLAPLPGSVVESMEQDGVMAPIGLEASGGVTPYRWMVNEVPVRALPGGTPSWSPDGPGFAHVSVTDAAGRSSATDIRVR